MLEIIGGVIDKRGLTGNGIASIENTATVTTDEKVTKTYTITFTNGDTYDFDVVSVNEGYASSVIEGAEAAKAASESARDVSISAKNDAVTAKNDAQTAKTQAEASATTATNKAAEAANSASSASGSAGSASSSATTATNAKNDAVAAKNDAVSAKNSAESAKTAAESAKDSAQQYAEDIEDLTVSATTLDTGEPATVTKSGGGSVPYNLAFGLPRGAKGETGDTGNGIASIQKTSTVGKVDTYTITFTNGTTSTFTVTNGADAIYDALGLSIVDGKLCVTYED